MGIEDWRREIDDVDRELLRLLNMRARLALKVGALKRAAGLPLYDSTREQEVLTEACRENDGPLDDRAVAKIFRRINPPASTRRRRITCGRRSEREQAMSNNAERTSLRVAFQGERGAFSEEAAVKLLGEAVHLVPRPTFESLFAAIDEGVADRLLAPIENSLAGSVHRSYDLLVESSLHIEAEVVIPITHNLVACPGATFEQLKTVESHPVALAQCERFFAAHAHLKRIATEDTAGSVRGVISRNDLTRAAVAGRRAAEIYGGLVLRERLEDHAENYTRFILLSPRNVVEEDADKLSLLLRLAHRPGALALALEPFARRGIDLLKIESRPVMGQPWQYRFYLDLKAAPNEREVSLALSELREHVEDVRVLGCYRSAQTFESQTELVELHK